MDQVRLNNQIKLLVEESKIAKNNTNLPANSTKSVDEINDKYVKGEVRIVTEQARYPLNTIVSLVDNSNSYILNPEFQRRHRWDTVRKSRLIESFIMNIPIPPIFLYEKEFAVYEVMDGLQRLTAIKQFYKNEFALENLIEWPELNGYRYHQLPDKVKKGIDRRYLSSIILLQETAKTAEEAQRLKQLVFERINSGGEKLNAQESRNAIYNGPFNQLCISLARDPFLCKMWEIPEPTREELGNKENISEELIKNQFFSKMADVELVLRYFAFRQIENWKNSLEEFLDETLEAGNSFSAPSLSEYKEIFSSTVKLVYEVLGESAFWVYRKRISRKTGESWDYFERPTKTAYDPIMYVFSLYLDKSGKLIENKEAIREQITDFYKFNYKSFEDRMNRSDVINRINLLASFIENFTK